MSEHRKKAFEHYSKQCKICESTDEIEVHHVDGNPANNQIDNLVPVCKDCHHKIHSGELEEWAEKILPKTDRTRRVTYLMGPKTQESLELIKYVTEADSDKEAIRHAVEEYNEIYTIIQDGANDLPEQLVDRRTNSTLRLSNSVEAILENHIESAEQLDSIKQEMTRVVAEEIFGNQVPVFEQLD